MCHLGDVEGGAAPGAAAGVRAALQRPGAAHDRPHAVRPARAPAHAVTQVPVLVAHCGREGVGLIYLSVYQILTSIINLRDVRLFLDDNFICFSKLIAVPGNT